MNSLAHILFIVSAVVSAAAAAAVVNETGPASLEARAENARRAYSVSFSAPRHAGRRVLDSYMSFSVELAALDQYTGSVAAPNTFSDALLTNFVNYTGHKPFIRVGGNSQDKARYVPTQLEPIRFVNNHSALQVTLGPAFFDLYRALPGVRYSHGFNLKSRDRAAWRAITETVPLACQALSPDETGYPRLYMWELGNEPHLYPRFRKGNNVNAEYTAEWLLRSRRIRQLVKKHCPDLAKAEAKYTSFFAPSVGTAEMPLNALASWAAGLGRDHSIRLLSKHVYMGGPGSTMRGTLMKHSKTMEILDKHAAEQSRIEAFVTQKKDTAQFPRPPQLILGEYNSIYGGGGAGVSNMFAAALWNLDFALYAASVGFGRIHLHQGGGASYNAWQAVEIRGVPPHTRAPYYGSIAVAAALRDTKNNNVTVVALTGHGASRDWDPAYAVYENKKLARIVVVNLRAHSGTGNGTQARPSRKYTFTIKGSAFSHSRPIGVQRLMASGFDVPTGITFDGFSYSTGSPVRLANVTTGEQLTATNHTVTVRVPDSSAALLNF